MNPQQLLDFIIKPALTLIGESGIKATILLLSTAAQETHCGEYVRQIGGGPGRGIYQCESATHNLVKNWLMRNNRPLHSLIVARGSTDERLVYDLQYATWIARVLYLSIPKPLPAPTESETWAYYKAYYNRGGKATREEWSDNWGRYVAPVMEQIS